MNPSAVSRDISSGELKPVYVLHGPDVISRDRLIEEFCRSVPDDMKDFNLHILHAEEASAQEILSQARTMPFFGGPKILIVKGFHHYAAADLELFNQYLEDPNDSSCLVLSADKIEKRSKFYKSIVKKDLDAAFESPKGKQLVQWVKDAVQRRGMAINEVAAQALVDQIGNDLMELEGEIEKLSLYAMGRRGIELDDVKTAARITPTANVFQLGDAIGDQRPGPALAHLSDLLSSSQPMPILAMLVRHFRLLARAKILNEQRVNKYDAAGILGMPAFAVGKMYNQSRQFNFSEIKKGLALLREASLALISTGPPEGLIMEKLILDLSSLRPKQRRSGPYGPS